MKSLYEHIPEVPGVYIMKDVENKILYIGKAGNLKRRVSSYFLRPHDRRIEQLVASIQSIDYETTDTALEALIKEAEFIKRFKPPFNVREKDDKSFLYVEFTKERFPRVVLVRGKDIVAGKHFGPFTSASNIREALKILRRIFPFSTHPPEKLGKFVRPCLEYEIGLCPGTCVGTITQKDYKKNIIKLVLFFEGKKQRIIRALQEEMQVASKKMEFEEAEKLRRRIFALTHIRDIAFMNGPEIGNDETQKFRIEGYDISNISGTSAVGSMVVFENGIPEKSKYRKFKIKTLFGPNDVGMLAEILMRRFKRFSDALDKDRWILPDLVLIDGGFSQVNTARRVLRDSGLKIPIVGLAKGPKRRRNDIIGTVPKNISLRTLIQVRDEAHRFAISYHKHVRARAFLP